MKRVLSGGKVLFLVLWGAFLCGCSLLSPPEQTAVEYYDLKPPEKIETAPVNVEQFVTFSGERQRMIRRKEEIMIRSSDFSKWMQTPGGMLTRYLRLAFRSDDRDSILKRADPVVIRGEVLTFEVNHDCAELGVRYSLKRDRKSFSKTILIKEKMNGKGPKAFAEAMSRAADRFARLLAVEIRNFPSGKE